MSSQKQTPRAVGSETVHDGRLIKLDVVTLELPGGGRENYEVARHPGGAAVVAVDAQGRVALLKQYRHALGEWLVEIPAGKLEPGESPMACAVRELEEEAGVRAGVLLPMGSVWTAPGFSDERIWLFLASGLSPGRQHLDRDEFLTLEWVLLDEAASKALAGEITDAKTVCGLLRAQGRMHR